MDFTLYNVVQSKTTKIYKYTAMLNRTHLNISVSTSLPSQNFQLVTTIIFGLAVTANCPVIGLTCLDVSQHTGRGGAQSTVVTRSQ